MLHPLFLQTAPPSALSVLGPIALPVALGGVAVYLLLPRPRPYPPVAGAAAGGLALLLAGWFSVRGGVITAEALLFYAFALIAIVAGGVMITQRNPARAALSFALVVLSTCGLFLLQAAPFLMAATIVIYAGAIVVTFLFVIMLAQQAGSSDADDRSREPLLATLTGFVLLGAILYLLHLTYSTSAFDGLLQRTARAADQDSVEGMRSVLGNEQQQQEHFDRLQEVAEGLRNNPAAGEMLQSAIDEARSNWYQPEVNAEAMKRSFARLRDAGYRVRDLQGSLQPAEDLTLSELSGPAPNRPPDQFPRDKQGRVALPAENTAYLGRSLFSDYLLAVELGGTLLLVATVGAIVIAGRRTERSA